MCTFWITLIFVTRLLCVSSGDVYKISVPEIVAFDTGGIRVIIPETQGITEFRFYGNVNEEIEPLRPGLISLVTRQKTNGRWILENRSINLKINDDIYYWIFVMQNRLGYVRQPEVFTVKALVSYFVAEGTNFSSSTPSPTYKTSTIPKADANLPTTTNVPTTDSLSCNDNIEAIKTLENQIRNLTKTVELLMDVVEKLPDAKTLTLSGRIPLDEDPGVTVKFFIWEKLDLNPKIVSTQRNEDGSITFEVKTLQEKINILSRAQEELKNSSISIF